MRWVLAAVGLAAVSATSALADDCLPYNEPVEVKGYYGSVLFPGMPGFEDVRRSDAKYEAAMLFLGATGICTTSPANDDFFTSLSAVSVIHLACSDTSIYEKLRELQGTPVTIRGKLFNADNANHKAPVLLGDCELVRPK